MNELNFKEVLTNIDKMSSGWYDQYRGQSVGRMIHYIYHIAGLKYADSCIFNNNNTVTYYGKLLATVDWSEGFPYFVFQGEFTWMGKEQTRLLDEGNIF